MIESQKTRPVFDAWANRHLEISITDEMRADIHCLTQALPQPTALEKHYTSNRELNICPPSRLTERGAYEASDGFDSKFKLTLVPARKNPDRSELIVFEHTIHGSTLRFLRENDRWFADRVLNNSDIAQQVFGASLAEAAGHIKAQR